MTWKQHAACRDFPPERIDAVFFYGETASTEAKDLCDRCVVKFECGEAGRKEQWGVWGGKGPRERGVPKLEYNLNATELRKTAVHRACATCGAEFQKITLRQRVCVGCKTNKEKKTA